MTVKLTAKPVIKEIYSKIKEEIFQKNYSPKLVIIFIGEDPSAAYYVRNLEKKGEKVGIKIQTKNFDSQISQIEFLNEIEKLNHDTTVHGIMIQKPLPSHLDEDEIVMTIDPQKDVDGFHPLNMGNLVLHREGFIPSTAAAVLEILRFYEIEVKGKNVVIIGRSNIVGKPLANLLLRKSEIGNATVTICHSRTKNIQEITQTADILIAAIGKPFFVTPDMIRENVVIIDVGINQIEDPERGYKYVGDVDFENCFEKASAITPVPGGVGSVTTALLLNNVLISCKRFNNRV
jgi:methylenetetrahydrofolate dehydrogenase (NADP+)/methenyltetrahydrofolate cyclohydrolase